MKMTQKLAGLLVVATLLGGVAQVTTTQTNAFASESVEGVQTRALSKPYVVYGAGTRQKTQTAQTLGISNNYQKLTTTGSDAKYIGLSGISDEAMISSVSIAPAEPKTGTLVNIEPFEGKNNITKVTAQQYAMAATMAGVDDVIITVTADKPVSGEAALAGVYKALDTDGIALNQQNTNAANNVLEATTQVLDTQGEKSDSKYAGKLTAAVTNTASELADRKQQGDNIDLNIIINQLTVNLEQNDLGDKVSDEQVNQIATALQSVNEAPISNSSDFVKSSAKLSDKLTKSTGDVMAKAHDFANSKDAHNASNWFVTHIWEPVVNFFSSLFN